MASKNEKPLRVIPSNGRGHQTEQRIFAREIHETFCAQRGCRFFGKHAQQGHCHTRTPCIGKDWEHIDAAFQFAERAATEQLGLLRKDCRGNPRAYLKWLEAHVWCGWVNAAGTLDELVRLRRDVAILRDTLQRVRRSRKARR
jgi:hypothetical protein